MTHRNVSLDVLRAIAIFLVLGRHMVTCPVEVNATLHTITTVWMEGGWIGVDLFFVISGFLVSGLLFREHIQYSRISIKRFLIRRGFKLYPSFWALILVTVIVRACLNQPVPTHSILQEISFTQNYLGGLWNHTWSLAVEEHFYILLVVLLVVLANQPSTRQHSKPTEFAQLPKFFVAIALYCLILRLITASTQEFSYLTHAFPTHLRIDSLLFGVVLSWFWHYRNLAAYLKSRNIRLLLLGVGVMLLSPAFIFPLKTTWWIPVFGVVIFYLGSGGVLLGALPSKCLSGRMARPLAQVGMYSYSIYLWHMPVNQWGTELAKHLLGETSIGIGISESIAWDRSVLAIWPPR
jgi:peptidoglycan/LPS O-acetylase OafA/YrhL